MTISKALRTMRARIGWTQRGAAKRLGMSCVWLCHLENGNGGLGASTRDKIERVYGVCPYTYAFCLKAVNRSLYCGSAETMLELFDEILEARS